MKKLQTNMQNHWLFSSNNIYFCKCQKADEKKKVEDEQNLEEWNSVRRCSEAKCQLVQTSYINKLNCSWFFHIINILLIELSRSVWENLDPGRVNRPHCVRFVLTTSVKILPYRPLAGNSLFCSEIILNDVNVFRKVLI